MWTGKCMVTDTRKYCKNKIWTNSDALISATLTLYGWHHIYSFIYIQLASSIVTWPTAVLPDSHDLLGIFFCPPSGPRPSWYNSKIVPESVDPSLHPRASHALCSIYTTITKLHTISLQYQTQAKWPRLASQLISSQYKRTAKLFYWWHCFTSNEASRIRKRVLKYPILKTISGRSIPCVVLAHVGVESLVFPLFYYSLAGW